MKGKGKRSKPRGDRSRGKKKSKAKPAMKKMQDGIAKYY